MKSSVSIFGGAYCNVEELVEMLLRKADLRLVSDRNIIETVACEHHSPKNRLEKVYSTDHSRFNRFIHERRFYIAQIKHALAKHMSENRSLLINGFASLLVPRKVSHNLRICLFADMRHRVAKLRRSRNLSEEEAIQWLHHRDNDCVEWNHSLYRTNDPWDPSLYDIVVQTDKQPSAEVADLVCESLARSGAQPTESSMSAVQDFQLAAKIELLMFGSGYDVQVTAESGAVELMLNRQVLMRNRLISEIRDRLVKMPEIKSIQVVNKFAASEPGSEDWTSQSSLPNLAGR